MLDLSDTESDAGPIRQKYQVSAVVERHVEGSLEEVIPRRENKGEQFNETTRAKKTRWKAII